MGTLVSRTYTREGKRIKATRGEVIYNLGCGEQRYEGVIGVDIRTNEGADVVCDLNQAPWPIESSSADGVLAFHVLEHLEDLNVVMNEIWRILKPGGRVVIEVPYFRHPGAFQDPTHIHFFTSRTMRYFCGNNKRETARYANARFREVGAWLGWPTPSRNFISRIVKRFVNHHPDFYDKYLSVLFPVPIVVFELEALKP